MPKKSPSSILQILAANRLYGTILVFAGALLLMSSGWYWWQRVYTNPHRVFWDMIDQNMTTASITRTTQSDMQGQNLRQSLTAQFGGDMRTLTQTALSSADNKVTTESITTPRQSFVRYIDIEQASPVEGQPPVDFSSIEGVWSDYARGQSDAAQQGAFLEALFGTVMVGNLPYEERRPIIETLRSTGAYNIDYENVRRESVNGRQAYTYEVRLKPKGYLTSAQKFYTAHGLNSQFFDPNQYDGTEEIPLAMTIDINSRQLRRVVYKDGSERVENFELHGVVQPIELPTSAISGEELQERINAAQSTQMVQ